jgi:50S ribosomal protein L16 3-hydroxylase
MLYLPPGIAHDGVALGECITYSIGFRAPTFQELLEPWLVEFADATDIGGRYADPGLAPTRTPGALSAAMVERVHRALARRRPRERDTRRFLLRHLSEPKAQVVFHRPARPLSPASFIARAGERGVVLDRATRMLYAGREVAINGDHIEVDAATARVLRLLADRRELAGSAVRAAPPGTLALLNDWHTAGWLALAAATDR